MLVVHPLDDSRSKRVLWLLEELELPCQIKHYQRAAITRLAPPDFIDQSLPKPANRTVLERGGPYAYGRQQQADKPGKAVVATSLLDRLLHHAVVIAIEGNSYRLREHAASVPQHRRIQPISKSPDTSQVGDTPCPFPPWKPCSIRLKTASPRSRCTGPRS